MRTLGKDSYWWKKEEKEWVMQDQNGDWYVYKRDETPPMKTKIKRTNQRSLGFSSKEYIIIALGAALGISFALNIVALIL
jgi:hypothetical protein